MADNKKNQYFRPEKRHKAEEIWLISYADLITLLLVFFALIIASSNPATSALKMEQVRNSIRQVPQPENTLEKIKEQIDQKIQEHQMQELVEVFYDEHGLTVILKETFLFELGKSDLKPENAALMVDFVKLFHGLPSYAHIAFEGYTDDNPIQENSSLMKNNWHLSVMRAFTVMEAFDKEGICKENCEIRGFGEYRPLKPNRDEAGKAIEVNQSANRRVVIRVF